MVVSRTGLVMLFWLLLGITIQAANGLRVPEVQWSLVVDGSSNVQTTGQRQLAMRRALPVPGGVVEIGTFKGVSIQVGPYNFVNKDPSGNTYDIVLFKVDNQGTVVWAFSGGGSLDDYGIDVVIDEKEHLYFGGFTNSPNFQFGSATLSIPATNKFDFYICKLIVNQQAQTFTYPWCNSGGGTENDQGQNLVYDRVNKWVGISGWFFSPVLHYGSGSEATTLNNANAVGTPTSDGFFVLYERQHGGLAQYHGQIVNGLRFGGSLNEQFVTMRGEGRFPLKQKAPIFYLGGFYASTGLTWAGKTLPQRGVQDAYTIAWNPLQKHQERWVYYAGSSLADNVVDLSLPWSEQDDTEHPTTLGQHDEDDDDRDGFGNKRDETGIVYVVGSYNNNFYYNPKATSVVMLSQGGSDTFIAKLNHGSVIWIQSLGGVVNDIGQSIGEDAFGHLFVMTQFFSASLTFFDNVRGKPPVLIATNQDASQATSDVSFIVLSSFAGTLRTYTSLNGGSLDYGGAMMIDRAGRASFGGYSFSQSFTYNNTYTLFSGNVGLIQRMWFMRTLPPSPS